MLKERPYTFDRVIRIAIFAVVVWALVEMAAYLADVLIPFVIAMLLAYLLNPLVLKVQSRISNRLAAILVTLSGVTAALVGLFMLVSPLVERELVITRDLVKNIAAERKAERETQA